MSFDESRRSQRPYRYGMVLLCIGALINWLGLAENCVEPIRYAGVACIVAGAFLICAAMCCWLHTPSLRSATQNHIHVLTAQVTFHFLINKSTKKFKSKNCKSSILLLQVDNPIHTISIDEPTPAVMQKPPDYEAVIDAPPSYDDAIKLNPSQLAKTSNDNPV